MTFLVALKQLFNCLIRERGSNKVKGNDWQEVIFNVS